MSGAYRRILWILAYTIIAVSPARADYHYVSHEGSNEYPYTSWATAADSIKSAVEAADPGDTVYIGTGEWQERVITTEADSNLAVIGAGTDSTFWWWDVLGEYTFRCYAKTFIEAIHFEHTRTACLRSSSGAKIYVDQCLFTGSNADGIVIGAMGSLHIGNSQFSDVNGAVTVFSAKRIDVHNCLVDGTDWEAVAIYYADTVIIENNITIDCPSDAISLPPNIDSSLVKNNLSYNRIIPRLGSCFGCDIVINSTFDNISRMYDNDAAIYPSDAFGSVYKNNGMSRMLNAFYIFNYDGWTVSASYFNLWDVDNLGSSDGPPIVWDTLGIQWAYPMYAGEEDYHLQQFSPLIDAGDPNILDVDGTRSDIGAYGGPGGSSYPYLDLPPLVPDSLSAIVIEDTIFINWRYNHEADFDRYQLHRETYSGFEPSILNLIGEPDTSYYVDTDLTPGHNYYYRIAAVDNQDNLSDYSVELEVITTGVEGGWGAEMPTITTIESNYPNPFNSQTTIVYTVANLGPLPARINIDIYDIMGRKVRNLVNERRGAGVHRITWDGRNDDGSDCPSGVYFAKISQWGVDYLDRHQKLVLLR